jgi:hypothetical protein
VFLVISILKRIKAWHLLLTLISLASLIASPALAAGETYTWKSASDASVIVGASGSGNFSSAVTFNRASASASGATYTGNATYHCVGETTDRTDPITITLDAKNYNNGTPSAATGAVTGGAVCGGINGTVASIYVPGVAPVTAVAVPPTTVQSCDQGTLSWLFCPVIDNVTQTLSNFASQDILKPLLQINTITPTNTPKLYQVWTHVRDLADVLFILVFLAIIASTLMEQDIAGLNPYTIKSIWVRLILATIAVQLSFLISGVIVDVGNVLGNGVGDLIGYIADPSKGAPSLTNFFGNLITGSVASVAIGGVALLATWEIALPILTSLMIGILVVFLTLIARYLVIAVLIVVSPLAFVAWVLPNTRDFTNDWAKVLTRLVMMYPIIVGIISIAGVINEILPFSNQTASNGAIAVIAGLVKPLVTIAAFLIIPASFKLAGRGLERAHGLLSGAGNTGKGLLKGSQFYKDGQDARKARQSSLMQNLSDNEKVKSFTESKNGLKRIGGRGFMTASGLALAGAASSPVGIQKAANHAEKERTKNLKEFDNISPTLVNEALMAAYGNKESMAKIKREAPALVSYTRTLAGRTALAGRANETGVLKDEHIQNILKSPMAGEFEHLMNAIDKNNYKEKPHIHRIFPNGALRPDFAETVRSYKAAFINNSLDKDVLESMVGEKRKDAAGRVTYVPTRHSVEIATAFSANMSPSEVRAMYDPSNRQFNAEDKRSFHLQAAGNNKAIWKNSDRGRKALTEMITLMDRQENADIFKDYYKNVLHKTIPTDFSGKEYDPQNNIIHYLTMRDVIKNHLKT